MNIIGRILAVLTGAFVLTSIAAAIAARAMKQRIVRVDAPDANEVKLAAIFEPINFRSTATAFRGGTLDLWYGGGIIDLRDAFLDPAGARLEVRAVFGGAPARTASTTTSTAARASCSASTIRRQSVSSAPASARQRGNSSRPLHPLRAAHWPLPLPP